MRPRSPLRLIATGVALVVVAALWRLLAPMPVGGSVEYVITHGISMLPEYEEGDLVIVRKAADYGVGDVIAYRSANLAQPILHRIVETDGEGLVTKGDNNSWLDSDRPTSAEVMGKAWVHLPGAGIWLARARSPIAAAVLLGLVALSFFVGNERKKKNERTGRSPMPRLTMSDLSPQATRTLAGAGAIALVFVALAIFSFVQSPVKRLGTDAPFEHVATFGYQAQVPRSPVYPDGKVDPGQPIFLRIVDELDVSFEYTIQTDERHAVRGDALLFARLSGGSGWKKAIPIAPRSPIENGRVHLEGTLDLAALRRLSTEIQTMTGLPESEQVVEIVGRAMVEGEIASQPFTEQFAPALTFTMNSYQLQVVKPGADPADPTVVQDPLAFLTHSQPGAVSFTDTRANDLSFLGMSVDISMLRDTSLAGAVIALIALFILWLRFSRTAEADEASRIATRYGQWLIPVESMSTRAHSTVQVKSMEALARLAELHERMILHDQSDGSHAYFVEQEGVLYCYRLRERKEIPELRDATLPGAARAADRVDREALRKAEVQHLRQELTEIEAEVLRQKAAPSDD